MDRRRTRESAARLATMVGLLAACVGAATPAHADSVVVDQLAAIGYPNPNAPNQSEHAIDGSLAGALNPDPDGTLDGRVGVGFTYETASFSIDLSSDSSVTPGADGSLVFALSSVIDIDVPIPQRAGRYARGQLFAYFTTGDSPVAWGAQGMLDLEGDSANTSWLAFSLRSGNDPHLARHYYRGGYTTGVSGDLMLGVGENEFSNDPGEPAYLSALSGVLAPNTTYTLDLYGGFMAHGSGGSAAVSASFTLGNPVPEPTTLLLVGLGAALLPVGRRQRE